MCRYAERCGGGSGGNASHSRSVPLDFRSEAAEGRRILRVFGVDNKDLHGSQRVAEEIRKVVSPNVDETAQGPGE